MKTAQTRVREPDANKVLKKVPMHPIFEPAGTPASSKAIPIWFVTTASWRDVSGKLPAAAHAFADASSFEPKPGRVLALPDASGAVSAVLFGIENPDGA